MRVAWVILLGAVACTEPDPLRNAHLAFLTPPGTQEGRVAFTPPVRVAIEDPAGNVIPVDTTVELDLVDQPIWPAGQPNIDLQGTTLVRSVAGIATFNDVSLSLPANSYRIRALVGADLSVTSEPFTVRLTFVSVSAGYFHSCGITIADYAYCWGINGSGELGDGTNLSRHIPNPTTGATQFRQVTASNAHSCGVTPDDTAYCWPGSVSAPTEDPPRIPTLVAGLGGLDRVSAAKVTGRTCGITTTGASYCWGGSGPTFAVGGAPVFVRIATGSAHTCGLTADGTAYFGMEWRWTTGR
ncbi:MAG TPA: hypothetical protein VJ867_13440 [Gemmatimonadaceae bacterium]|nr:hypothetical protein [Gemmatimonadaceae bacterium]